MEIQNNALSSTLKQNQICNSNVSNLMYKDNLSKVQVQNILRHYGFTKLYEKKHKLVEKLNKLRFYLYQEKHIIRIQKCVRNYITSLRTFLHGEIYTLPYSYSVNHEDFCTLENLSTLPKHELISFTNSNGSIFTFKIQSLLRLYHSPNVNRNPYTREKLPQKLFDKMFEIIYRNRHKPQKRNCKYKHSKYWENRKVMYKIETQCSKLNYNIKYDWIMNTPLRKLHKLYGILHDIWLIHGNLTTEVKKQLVSSPSELFTQGKYSFWYVSKISTVRREILRIIFTLVNHSDSSENQVLGIIIVLCGLIKINDECRAKYSWLDL